MDPESKENCLTLASTIRGEEDKAPIISSANKDGCGRIDQFKEKGSFPPTRLELQATKWDLARSEVSRQGEGNTPGVKEKNLTRGEDRKHRLTVLSGSPLRDKGKKKTSSGDNSIPNKIPGEEEQQALKMKWGRGQALRPSKNRG